MIQIKKELFKIFFMILFLIVFIPASNAGKTKKIAVFTFKINAAQDLVYIKEGIMDMLSTRLYLKDKVVVVAKELIKEKVAEFKGRVNKETAFKIGKSLDADYVILGSLTVFGDSVSMDAKIFDVAQEGELFTTFTESTSMDELIPMINKFAKDIKAKITGQYIQPPVKAKATEEEGGPKGFIRVKEKAEEKGIGHTQTFKTGIVGLDMGDIDGDGNNELVFIDRNTIYIYKWVHERFTEFRVIKGKWVPNYVYLSIADLDGNGRAEIYISNLTESDVSSFVLEWRSGEFVSIAKRQRWFFRIIDLHGKGKTLIGQKRMTRGDFTGDVYILKKDGDHFSKAERLKLPSMANVFNFVQGNLITKDRLHTLVLRPDTEYLYLFDQDGEEIWRSEEEFGGTGTHMVAMDSSEEETWIYLAPPIFLSDIDMDGLREVIICKNKSSVGRVFEKIRMFSSGKLHFLGWDILDLTTKWESKKMPGAITGYCIKDVDNDGKSELVIAISLRSKSIFGKSNRSQVVVYNLAL